MSSEAKELRQYELLVEALQWLPAGTVVDFCDRDDFIEEVRRAGWRPRRECKDHKFIDSDECVYCHWEPGDVDETVEQACAVPVPSAIPSKSEGEWAVECLDAWTARSEARYYEVDKMGFDAAALGVGRQWRCNCFEVQNSPGRETRKVHIANGLSYESANDVRLAAARALYAADNSLPPPPKAPDAT